MIIGFDVETTGLDFSKDTIIEIGAILMSNDFKTVSQQLNLLVRGPQLSDEIIKLTGITQKELDEKGVKMDEAMQQLSDLCDQDLDGVVAYNAQFDKQMFYAEVARGAYTLNPRIQRMLDAPWVCAMEDAESNYGFKCWKLSHLALDKGVAVNPADLHRAVADVELMRKMLIQSGETFETLYAYHQDPWCVVQALVEAPWKDGGRGTTAAKQLGFTWEKVKGSDQVYEKSWVKKVKQKDMDKFLSMGTIRMREVICN